MMMKLGDRPAFPVDVGIHLGASDKGGMTTRTWLAGMALQGLLSNSVVIQAITSEAKASEVAGALAVGAVEQADALIVELEKEP